MNFRCYYFAAGSYIHKFKEALLEVADINRRRDEFIHNSRVEISGFVLFWAISRKLKQKRCTNYLQITLKILYISAQP